MIGLAPKQLLVENPRLQIHIMNYFQQATVNFGSRKFQLKQACFRDKQTVHKPAKFSLVSALLLMLFVATVISTTNAMAGIDMIQKPRLVTIEKTGPIKHIASSFLTQFLSKGLAEPYKLASSTANKSFGIAPGTGLNSPLNTTSSLVLQNKAASSSLCTSYQKWTAKISLIELRRPIVKLLRRCDRIGQQLGKQLAHQLSTLALFFL